jgi:serine/threonine protein kinase
MYSLGVILLQMLIDYVPLHHLDKSRQNKRYGVNVETWRSIFNGHPKRLKTILYKLLDKNPEHRFSNLREMIKELKLLKDEYIPSAPSESNLSPSPFRTLTHTLEGF